jgi:2'-5' RNA ligase
MSEREPTLRSFVAVPIGDQLRADLAAAVDGWRLERDAPNLRWTDADGWHVTRAFLGQVPSTLVAPVADALSSVSRRSMSFRLASGRLGAFPSPNRARVIWYRIEDDGGRLALLANAVHSALAQLVPRLADEASLRPHLTLARARGERGLRLADWLARREAPVGSIEVDRVVLYRSHVGPGPAQYEPLASLPFGPPSGADVPVKEASVHG